MTKTNPVADEKNFVSRLVDWISRQEEVPTRDKVETRGKVFGHLL